MPLNSRYRCIVCLGIFLSFCILANAQHVLNGSFEDNDFPYRASGGALTSMIKLYFKNVEYTIEDTTYPGASGNIIKDTLGNTWLGYNTLNFKPAPFGKTYLILSNSRFPNKRSFLKLLLSDSLVIGKQYTIRFFAGNSRLSPPTSVFTHGITLGFSQNNIKPQLVLDTFILKDTTGGRFYASSFIAQQTYKYIYVYCGVLFNQSSSNDFSIDNIILDTCVSSLPKRETNCVTFPYTLMAVSAGQQVLWNTGDTSQNITVTKQGIYIAHIYDSLGCVTIDSIVITDKNTPGSVTDTFLCTPKPIILTAQNAAQYLWNTGDITSSITVNTGGIYWVTKTNITCTQTDTFYVKEIIQPSSTSLDAFVCEGSTLTLTAGPAQTYLWNTGEQTQQLQTQTPGLFWVTKHNEQCTGADSFIVSEKPVPVITSLKDTTVCFDQVAQILLDAGQFKSYLWKPTGETTRTIYSNTAQIYLLSVTDSNNCSTHKQVAVMETCPEFIFVPNAFTPNGDGLNDVFLPSTRNLTYYQMNIVNRWGEIIFTTKNPQQGWDGKDAQADVYVVFINYKVDGKELQSIKQNVSLLR